MAELRRLLDRIAQGEVRVGDAVPEFRRVLHRGDGDEQGPEVSLQRMAGVLDERAGTNTFIEVTAARIAGHLSDEQYAALRQAVTG